MQAELILLIILQFLDQNNAVLIDFRDKIPSAPDKEPAHDLHGGTVFFVDGFHNIHKPPDFIFNVEFLGSVIDIDKKHVVENQILDKTVLVVTVFIGRHERHDLADSDPAQGMDIISGSLRQQDILRAAIVIDLKEMTAFHFLGVCGRGRKLADSILHLACFVPCLSNDSSLQIKHGKIRFRDIVKVFYGMLDRLV